MTTTRQKMTAKKAATIAASVRSDATSVRIGCMTKARWDANFDAAVAAGVEFDAAVRAFRQAKI